MPLSSGAQTNSTINGRSKKRQYIELPTSVPNRNNTIVCEYRTRDLDADHPDTEELISCLKPIRSRIKDTAAEETNFRGET